MGDWNRINSIKYYGAGLRVLFVLLIIVSNVLSQVRIKDITRVENAKQEILIGYGLVVGLDGTGDRPASRRGAIFTVQSISNMLERFGINVPKEQLRTRNVAAVMVTAKTPAFGRVGSRFDVVVSSLGDAKSLEGGTLLLTPLMGPDGMYYGVAQGPVSIGGYNIETTAGEKVRKNHALVGRVPNGGILEKAPEGQDFDLSVPLRLILNNPDFITATRIADAINKLYNRESGVTLAKAINANVVEVKYPDFVKNVEDGVTFIASIETLTVRPDVEARVVINERTGTIVAGGNVKLSEVLVSHGSLTIHVRRRPVISQPSAPFSSAGQTVVTYITETTIQETEAKTAVVRETTTVADLAQALNELGLKPRDIIAIFQAIKEAGALNARLIIM
ncbi:MAG: flagellar basal body P-ring protein FlgI [Candidatus Marinimicrobia bacterium]|nr:flagellar basal body P-ring protein FlgI [Candidatus Neomarinimicrobiota bacterium]